MESAGIDPESVAQAMAYEKMSGRHIGKNLAMIGGGVAARALSMIKLLEKLEGERPAFGEEGGAASQWSYLYIETSRVLNAMYGTAIAGATARAKIALYQSQIQGTSKGKGKPGFSTKMAKAVEI